MEATRSVEAPEVSGGLRPFLFFSRARSVRSHGELFPAFGLEQERAHAMVDPLTDTLI